MKIIMLLRMTTTCDKFIIGSNKKIHTEVRFNTTLPIHESKTLIRKLDAFYYWVANLNH